MVSRTQQGRAPKYLCDLLCKPTSAVSLRPLRSLDRLDLFVPWARTAMAQHRAFAIVGPFSWNDLPLLRSKILAGVSPSSAHCLKTFLFPWSFHAESASTMPLLTLYKFSNENTICQCVLTYTQFEVYLIYPIIPHINYLKNKIKSI